ncbi:lysophospholipid acyltransferase 5-like [Antedon mediterranea]|uniref:lysophospholipid acyltransferase 5-like n=1 Tax=Antedon mediterranea TaxID=105859 RepID=UPI003AF9E4EB
MLGYLLQYISNLTEIPEPGIRLLFAVLCGYLLAWFQRDFLHGKSSTVKHVYFSVTGLIISYFCYGIYLYHSLINILANYLILAILGGTLPMVIISFTFNLSYLVIAYLVVSTDDYDILWTTPQCIMCLRLIGLAFDLYDGHRPQGELSKEQSQLCIKAAPSLLEITSYTFYFGGYLVGPQFPMRRFQDFVDEKFLANSDGKPPATTIPALKRLFMGVVYAMAHTILGSLFPTEFLSSQEFNDSSLFYKIFFVCIWGRVLIARYISIWLFAEGSCILSGLAFNGYDDNNKVKWDGVANVKIRKYESSCGWKGLIESFNINTSQWAARYIYKRLRFLGNKLYSQAVTLLFLALWHGYFLGYFVCFFLEMLCVQLENHVTSLIEKSPKLKKFFNNPVVKPISYICSRFLTTSIMGYALVAFTLLRYHRFSEVYRSMYHIWTIVILAWIPLFQFVLNPMFRKPKSTASQPTEKATEEKKSE